MFLKDVQQHQNSSFDPKGTTSFLLTVWLGDRRLLEPNQCGNLPTAAIVLPQNWLGFGGMRPDLVIRFGYAPLLPMSMRRPVKDVIV